MATSSTSATATSATATATLLSPRALNYRMPAEWELHHQTWMLWPVRLDNWRSTAAPAREAWTSVIEAISRFEHVSVGVPPAASSSSSSKWGDRDHVAEARACLAAKGITNATVFEIDADDAWVRDSGPTYLVSTDEGKTKGAAIQWQFNAWGKIYEPFNNDQKVAQRIMDITKIDQRFVADFILEGGSIHVDGEGTCLTTEECLLNENRNPHLSKAQIENHLMEYLNVKKVIWLPLGLTADEDTNGHIDNFCCFVRPGKVLLSWTDDSSDVQFEISRNALAILSNERDAEGRELEVVKIPIPKKMFYTQELLGTYGHADVSRQVGQRLAGSYVNFLIVNGGIVFPTFDCAEDSEAEAILKECFPDRIVVGVPGKEILLGGGNIHCITQQQPYYGSVCP